ncbi:MAG TPA: hypothetical protein VFB90_01510 [Dehalococcoidia bacterium]|nr:hypothetical protein [Dehalococcoidia bacterium]
MDILHLIDRLEEMAAEARKLPVGSGVVMNRQRLLDLVDRMRVSVPAEVYTATEVLQRRDEVLAQAQEEATRLVALAQAEVEKRLEQDDLVKAAEERAQRLMREARDRAEEMVREAEVQARLRLDDAHEESRQQMHEANLYALQTLQRLSTQLEQFMTTVQRGMETLEQRERERPDYLASPEDAS